MSVYQQMHTHEYNLGVSEVESNQSKSAIFSLEESKTHYMVAVDIPTIPSSETEILSKRNELIVEGKLSDNETAAKQIYFRCRSTGSGVKATYRDGVLWLLLPKDGLVAG